MSELKPILTTKIQVPPLAPNLLPRKRLYHALDELLSPINRLTLISAPAGYGKTSLVSGWVQERNLPTGWISLDDHDNDPVRFGSYLYSSLQKACPELVPADLTSSRFSIDEIQEQILIPLLIKLADSPRSTLIVLDDYHLIQNLAIQLMVEFLLENLPPSLHIILLTRADPALPIARLRGRGQLNELRMQDLRFQPDEVRKLLSAFNDLHLTEEDIDTLTRRTEGWIAGLQMAIASLRGHVDQSGFINGFSGGHQYIMDFLLDEVLRRQTPRLQSFLLKTSILDRLSGPLCDAILEAVDESHPPSETVLRELARANLFVVPLDSELTWFRYHRLFADLLEVRLGSENPECVRMLHRQASAWFEAHDQLEQAIQHALEGEDTERAANMLDRISQSLLMRSETETFLRWIQLLPPETIASRPRLVIFQAWALLFQGAPLRVVQALLQTDRCDQGLPGGSTLLSAFIALTRGQVEEGLRLSEQALDLLPAEEMFLRDFAVFCSAGAKIAVGDLEAGKRILKETTQASLSSGNRSATVIFLSELAEIRQKEMRLQESKVLYEQARAAAQDEGGNLLPIGGRALIGLGALALETNQLETAEMLLNEGIELTSRWNLFSTLDGHLSLATLYNLQGDETKLNAKISELYELARRFDATEIDDMIVALVEAGFNARLGQFQTVQLWVEERGLQNVPSKLPDDYAQDHLLGRMYKYELPIVIRWLIAEEEFERAEESIQLLIDMAAEANRSFLVLEGLILRAVLYHAQSESQQSLDALIEALKLAQPQDAMRLFLSEGPVLRHLIHNVRPCLDSPPLIKFVDKILNAAQSQPIIGQLKGIEALSPRELDVLHLLPSELTAEELADELFISVNTVRTHMKNIYSKLGVHSRHQAVDRLRTQQLQ